MATNRMPDRKEEPSIVTRDCDSKFAKAFEANLKELGVRANALPKSSPDLKGCCERFIQTMKLECFAKFINLGEQHRDHLLSEFTSYYNSVRSHMEREHLPPIGIVPGEVKTLTLDQVVVKSHIGGIVKEFEWKSA